MTGLKEKLSLLQKIAKERTVKTQTVEYDLETLVKKIDKNVIKLNPEYQRNHRWTEDFSSRLIESLILNIPVPFVYLSQDIDVDDDVDDDVARYSVIDGQQRLTAIHRFFKNKYPLEGLDVLTDLNNAYYRDFPPFLVRRLEERTIRCLRIDSTLDGQVKYDIFERLNSGSVKLEAQELRNATCRGPFKALVKRLSKNKDFTTACQLDDQGKRVKKMEDEELVLRFYSITHKDNYNKYKGGFKSFLTENMLEFNKFDDVIIKEMEESFKEVFSYINSAGDDSPFGKYRSENGGLKRMSKFNSAVFDSLILAVSKADKSNPIELEKFRQLFHDKDYFSSVEGSVNDVSKLNIRILKGLEAIN